MRQVARINLPNVLSLTVSPDKQTIAANVKQDNVVHVKLLKKVEGEYTVVKTVVMPSTKAPGRNQLEFSPDGKVLFATDQEFLLALYGPDFATSLQINLQSTIANTPTMGHCVAVHPTMPYIAVSSNQAVYGYLFVEGTFTKVQTINFGAGITTLTFDESGNYLLAIGTSSASVFKSPLSTSSGTPTLGSVTSITGRTGISGGALADNRIIAGRSTLLDVIGTADNWANMSVNISTDRALVSPKMLDANKKSVFIEMDGSIHVLDRWTLETKFAFPVSASAPIVSAM